ncbi:MAG: biopolymer transporter ExbD [Planctomycetes bacterium]|nr:biopolymer transporter ExbD [Planctomycetota bacterium]
MGAENKRDSGVDSVDGFTSMIDIVFLLLIFFILQPFKSPEKVMKSELPKRGPSENTIDITSPVRVSIKGVDDDVTFYVDGRLVGSSDEKVPAVIMRNANYSLEGIAIIIDPEQKVAFSHVISVYNHCFGLGAQKVSFAAPPAGG